MSRIKQHCGIMFHDADAISCKVPVWLLSTRYKTMTSASERVELICWMNLVNYIVRWSGQETGLIPTCVCVCVAIYVRTVELQLDGLRGVTTCTYSHMHSTWPLCLLLSAWELCGLEHVWLTFQPQICLHVSLSHTHTHHTLPVLFSMCRMPIYGPPTIFIQADFTFHTHTHSHTV